MLNLKLIKKLEYTSMIKFLSIFSILFIFACASTSPTNVKTSDAQKVTSIEYGFIKSSFPVKIKGESDWVGATAGAMIGGLLGTAVCGEEEIIGTKCQDIAVVFGTIGGAATTAGGISLGAAAAAPPALPCTSPPTPQTTACDAWLLAALPFPWPCAHSVPLQ